MWIIKSLKNSSNKNSTKSLIYKNELNSIIEYRMYLPWSDVHQKNMYSYITTLVTLDEYKDKQLKQDNYSLRFNQSNLIKIINNKNKLGCWQQRVNTFYHC